jgi:enoyl-CoA hydratase/carnithine racemase
VLASPKTRNALSLDMMNQLISDLKSAAEDPAVRSIVLRAEGGHVFSAGHNLKEMTAETGRAHHRAIFNTCEQLMQLIGRLPVPVIAAVDGLAAAAGCQLVASADIAVATPGSRFSTPGAAVGLFCHTPGIPLARRVPRAVSGYMLLTGEPINGAEALTAGLVSKARS